MASAESAWLMKALPGTGTPFASDSSGFRKDTQQMTFYLPVACTDAPVEAVSSFLFRKREAEEYLVWYWGRHLPCSDLFGAQNEQSVV